MLSESKRTVISIIEHLSSWSRCYPLSYRQAVWVLPLEPQSSFRLSWTPNVCIKCHVWLALGFYFKYGKAPSRHNSLFIYSHITICSFSLPVSVCRKKSINITAFPAIELLLYRKNSLHVLGTLYAYLISATQIVFFSSWMDFRFRDKVSYPKSIQLPAKVYFKLLFWSWMT